MENKKSTLSTRLKSYSAIAGTIVAAANTAGAQVVYTDVSPDALVPTGSTYDLDLNNDGTVDYQFAVSHGTYMYGTFPIQYDIGIVAPAPGSGNAIDTLTGGPTVHNTGDAINGSLLWVDDAGASYQLLGANFPLLGYQTGNFLGATDKYMGFRFKISGADHYGWARFDFNSTATLLTMKDYAYDATPGTSILAGAMPTAINEHAAELANAVTIFGADKSIRVNMNNAKAEGMVVITNTLGQEVAKVSITDAQMTIPMDNANTGIYFVSVIQESATFTQKVIVK